MPRGARTPLGPHLRLREQVRCCWGCGLRVAAVGSGRGAAVLAQPLRCGREVAGLSRPGAVQGGEGGGGDEQGCWEDPGGRALGQGPGSRGKACRLGGCGMWMWLLLPRVLLLMGPQTGLLLLRRRRMGEWLCGSVAVGCCRTRGVHELRLSGWCCGDEGRYVRGRCPTPAGRRGRGWCGVSKAGVAGGQTVGVVERCGA